MYFVTPQEKYWKSLALLKIGVKSRFCIFFYFTTSVTHRDITLAWLILNLRDWESALAISIRSIFETEITTETLVSQEIRDETLVCLWLVGSLFNGAGYFPYSILVCLVHITMTSSEYKRHKTQTRVLKEANKEIQGIWEKTQGFLWIKAWL